MHRAAFAQHTHDLDKSHALAREGPLEPRLESHMHTCKELLRHRAMAQIVERGDPANLGRLHQGRVHAWHMLTGEDEVVDVRG